MANCMRLLLLPKEVQQEVARGKLPAGQARALLGLENEAMVLAAARDVIAKGLSTRETERLVKRLKSGRRRRGGETSLSDANLRSLVEQMQRSLGTKVRLLHRAGSGRGKVVIEYYSLADLERIIRMMTGDKS